MRTALNGVAATRMLEEEGSTAPLPIRVVTRLLAELQTAIVSQGVRAIGGDLDRFAIYTLIVRQTLEAMSRGAPPSGISAHSMASSFSRPYETIRRHSFALVDAGFCDRVGSGLVASPKALSDPAIRSLMDATHDSFVRFVEDLRILEVPMPRARAGAAYAKASGVQAAIDTMLAVADTNRDTHVDWTDLVIFSTVMCRNVQAFARNPGIALIHRDHTSVVPAHLLQPVRPSVIARTIGISETTVRRRIKSMVIDGRLETSRGGAIASQAWLNQPASVAISTASYRNIRRILERLAVTGFPFDEPPKAYLVRRPADVSFDGP